MAVNKEAVDKLLSGFLSTNKERLEEVSRSNPNLSSAVNGVLDYVARSYGSGVVEMPKPVAEKVKQYTFDDGSTVSIGDVVAVKSTTGRYFQNTVIDIDNDKIYLESVDTDARSFIELFYLDVDYKKGKFKIGLVVDDDTTLKVGDEVEFKNDSGKWIKYTIDDIKDYNVFFGDKYGDFADLTFDSVRKWWKQGLFRFPEKKQKKEEPKNDELLLSNNASLKSGDYYLKKPYNFVYQIESVDIEKDEVVQRNLLVTSSIEGISVDYILKQWDEGNIVILNKADALEALEEKKKSIGVPTVKNDEILLFDGKVVRVGDYYWQPKFDYVWKIEDIDVANDVMNEMDILTGKKETDVSIDWLKGAYKSDEIELLTKQEAENIVAEKKKASAPVTKTSEAYTITFPDGSTIRVGDFIMLTNTGDVLKYEKIDKKARIVYFEDVESGEKGVEYYLTQIMNRWDDSELEILDDNAVKQYMKELEEKQEKKKEVEKKPKPAPEKPAEEKKKRGRPAKSTGLYIPTDKNELKELITSTEILVQYDKTYKDYLKELKEAYKKMLS
jgi:hypothetical protein